MVNIDPPSPEADVMRRRHINAYLSMPVYKWFRSGLAAASSCAVCGKGWDAGDRKGIIATPVRVVGDLIVTGQPNNGTNTSSAILMRASTRHSQLVHLRSRPAKRREMIHQAMVEMARADPNESARPASSAGPGTRVAFSGMRSLSTVKVRALLFRGTCRSSPAKMPIFTVYVLSAGSSGPSTAKLRVVFALNARLSQ
jgi:hypothetical protein